LALHPAAHLGHALGERLDVVRRRVVQSHKHEHLSLPWTWPDPDAVRITKGGPAWALLRGRYRRWRLRLRAASATRPVTSVSVRLDIFGVRVAQTVVVGSPPQHARRRLSRPPRPANRARTGPAGTACQASVL
jgi:hypothetical protein